MKPMSDQRVEPDQPVAGHPEILMEEVFKSYPVRGGEIHALAPTSLAIEDREFVSILGPSGCGKSTLLNVVSGLIPASGGRVACQGKTVRSPLTSAGFVFQEDRLLPWKTVEGNILLQAKMHGMPKAVARAALDDLLRLVGLEKFAKVWPHELSGGMRQRVSICRALIHAPKLLFMDEPFGALDAMTRDQMNVDLDAIVSSTETTVIFVTHSISEAIFLSDRVLVMSARPGRKVADMKIELEGPRVLEQKESPEFVEYVREGREHLVRNGAI